MNLQKQTWQQLLHGLFSTISLSFNLDKKLIEMKNKLVTTELLGKTSISKQAYVNAENTPIIIDTDYLGDQRNKANPLVGPFELNGKGYRK